MTSPASRAAPIPQDKQRLLLLELADRCEVEEPSRELDAHIYVAVIRGAYADETMEQRLARAQTVGPAFTTSLDAAVTLELAGFYVTVVTGKGQPCAVGWLDVESGMQFSGEAKTEPMARCAAALRARAAPRPNFTMETLA